MDNAPSVLIKVFLHCMVPCGLISNRSKYFYSNYCSDIKKMPALCSPWPLISQYFKSKPPKPVTAFLLWMTYCGKFQRDQFNYTRVIIWASRKCLFLVQFWPLIPIQFQVTNWRIKPVFLWWCGTLWYNFIKIYIIYLYPQVIVWTWNFYGQWSWQHDTIIW